MNLASAWRTLGISRTAETGAIRRAYADRLKALDLDREIDAYAALRDARDTALVWARRQAAAPPGGSLTDIEGDGADPPSAPDVDLASGWAYAAPLIAPERPTDAPGVRIPGTLLPAYRALTPEPSPSGMVCDIAAPAVDAFALPVLSAALADAAGHGVQPGRDAASALHELLYAGEDEETWPGPLDPRELALVQRRQRAVLRDAAAAELSRHAEIENWLADTLAGAWPRSAPLLSEAAEAFGWEREAGKLGERSTIGFLNSRLRGLRFYEKVQDRAHPLYGAWQELSRPGRSNMISRMRAKRHDVEKLLAGVRKNFPELEEFFDPQRVASWSPADQSNKISGPSRWLWIIGVVGVFRLIVAIGDATDDPSPSRPSPVIAESALSEADSALVGQAIADAFGIFMSLETLRQSQPDLPDTIISNRLLSRVQNKPDDEFRRSVVEQVRMRMLQAGLAGSGDDLHRVQQIRLGLLRAARRSGPEACMNFARTGSLPATVVLPESLQAEEQQLALAMLQAHKLVPPHRQSAKSAALPGKLIGQVMDQTKLTEAAVRQALQKKGSNTVLCSVSIALLDRTLAWPGTERRAILSIL